MPPRPDSYAESRTHFIYYVSSAAAAVFCVVLLYLAVGEARGVLARYRHGVSLEGTVAKRREISSSSNSRSKRTLNVGSGSTTIEYTVRAAYRGKEVQVVNHFRSSLDEYRVGERVPVVYVPAEPQHSRLATPTELYGQLLQLLGFGLLSGLAAGLLWLRKITANALFSSPPKLPPGSIQ